MEEISWLEQWVQKADSSLREIRFDVETGDFFDGAEHRIPAEKVRRLSHSVEIVNYAAFNEEVGRKIAKHKSRRKGNAYEVLNDTTIGHRTVHIIYYSVKE